MLLRLGIWLCVFVILPIGFTAYSWGFKAHQLITQMAMFSLPKEMLTFYKSHWEELRQASIQPDIRRYVWDDEKPRHYIDLDLYSATQQDSLKKGWNVAIIFIGEDTLMANGILPFSLETTVYELTQAFREKNERSIIRYSGDLAHYVGDAHVPLHTTANYNGQLTGQRGIHALWESRIPELESDEYSFWQTSADYIPNVRSEVWDIIYSSHAKVDSVISIEKLLSADFMEDRKYTFRESGKSTIKTYSQNYVASYSKRLMGMVENQMKESAQLTANLWFTCWVNAGQPDLEDLIYGDADTKMDSVNTHDSRSILHH